MAQVSGQSPEASAPPALVERVRAKLPRGFVDARYSPGDRTLEFVPGPGTSASPRVTLPRNPTDPVEVRGDVPPGWGSFEVQRYNLRSSLFMLFILVTHLTFILPVSFLVFDPLGLRRIPDPTGGTLITLLLVMPILIYALVALWITVRAVRPRWENLAVILDAQGRNVGEAWTGQGDLSAARTVVEDPAVRAILEGRGVRYLRIRGTKLFVEAKASTMSDPKLTMALAAQVGDLVTLATTVASLRPVEREPSA